MNKIRDYGFVIGNGKTGKLNTISDVPGVSYNKMFKLLKVFDDSELKGNNYMLKGGIGSSSRLIFDKGTIYTIGVLVKTNYATINELLINGERANKYVEKKYDVVTYDNKFVSIALATDIPFNKIQFDSVINYTNVGVKNVGLNINKNNFNVSGCLVCGDKESLSFDTDKLNYILQHVSDSVEEAILNSFCQDKDDDNDYLSLIDCFFEPYWKNLKLDTYIDNYPIVNQFPDYPVGCESVALYTLLKYYNIDVSINDIIDKLKKGEKPHYEGEIMYGGDPEIEFLGDPKDIYSYGVYEKPIADVANIYKKGIKNISGLSLDSVLDIVRNGHPVQVWSSINCLEPKIANHSWIDKRNNKKIIWKQPFHSLVIIGFSKKNIVVSDPDSGSIRVFDKSKFEKAYDFFGKRALYYEN